MINMTAPSVTAVDRCSLTTAPIRYGVFFCVRDTFKICNIFLTRSNLPQLPTKLAVRYGSGVGQVVNKFYVYDLAGDQHSASCCGINH